MSFLKQLLTPFIEFDEDVKKDPKYDALKDKNIVVRPKDTVIKPVDLDAEVQHPLINDNKPSHPPVTIKARGPIVDPSKPLAEHVQYFEGLIDKANRENPLFTGPDYKEFIDAKIDIDSIADENLKYRTAFNILKSSGLTKDKLLMTGHEYLNIIGRDLNAFQTAHSQKYKKELSQKELDLQRKVEELQALTQKVNALKNEIANITNDINHSQQKLNATKNSFLLAGELKQQEIQNELKKISQYFD